mmetsp:Transcript_8887/g.21731  ORF Transcript_8887/g.21731 Transcript_8887/m.21731 type:complete len:91 (-) Transcript_8887:1214-1486(-)
MNYALSGQQNVQKSKCPQTTSRMRAHEWQHNITLKKMDDLIPRPAFRRAKAVIISRWNATRMHVKFLDANEIPRLSIAFVPMEFKLSFRH